MKKTIPWLARSMAACFGIAAGAALAWPDKPVTLVVPYPAGGGVDPVARLVAKELSQRWKQPVVVVNRAGASGSIGAAHVARAQPDGLTIMMSATAEVVINQFIMKDMQYDPEKDLQPVTLAVRLPFILLANNKAPYSDIAGLVSYARQHPGKVTYASSGTGTPQHLAAALLGQLSNTELTHVPYKGVAPSISALLGGEVAIGFAGLPTGLPHSQSGALKALAMSSGTRSPAAPKVPAIAETAGLKDFDLTQWFGIFVPAGTPAAIATQIRDDIARVLQDPAVRSNLESQGAQPSGMPTAEFAAFLKQEREKFRRIVESANIQQ